MLKLTNPLCYGLNVLLFNMVIHSDSLLTPYICISGYDPNNKRTTDKKAHRYIKDFIQVSEEGCIQHIGLNIKANVYVLKIYLKPC